MVTNPRCSLNTRWWVLLIATIVLYVFSLAVTIVMGIFFAKSASTCARNVAFLLVNAIICFLYSILSIHPKVSWKIFQAQIFRFKKQVQSLDCSNLPLLLLILPT